MFNRMEDEMFFFMKNFVFLCIQDIRLNICITILPLWKSYISLFSIIMHFMSSHNNLYLLRNIMSFVCGWDMCCFGILKEWAICQKSLIKFLCLLTISTCLVIRLQSEAIQAHVECLFKFYNNTDAKSNPFADDRFQGSLVNYVPQQISVPATPCRIKD